MSRRDPRVTLAQISEYALKAQELCAAYPLPLILSDWQRQAAFERVMEVLGEAVKRLPPDLIGQYPTVDWRGIAGMRDRVSHSYDAIDYEILWQAVQTGIPGLLSAVRQMILDVERGSD